MAKKKEVKEEGQEKKEGGEPMQRAAAQAIQSYFTKDINEQIGDMTDEVMYARLRALEMSDYWIAILRYNNLRLLNSQSALNTMDPVQNPTAIGRQQGAMMGIVDLQNAIIMLVESEREAQKETREIQDTF